MCERERESRWVNQLVGGETDDKKGRIEEEEGEGG